MSGPSLIMESSLLTKNIPERSPLFPMGTLTVTPRAVIYAAFLDLIDHLQLLHVALSTWYTNNCLWHNNSLDINSMLKANYILLLN